MSGIPPTDRALFQALRNSALPRGGHVAVVPCPLTLRLDGQPPHLAAVAPPDALRGFRLAAGLLHHAAMSSSAAASMVVVVDDLEWHATGNGAAGPPEQLLAEFYGRPDGLPAHLLEILEDEGLRAVDAVLPSRTAAAGPDRPLGSVLFSGHALAAGAAGSGAIWPALLNHPAMEAMTDILLLLPAALAAAAGRALKAANGAPLDGETGGRPALRMVTLEALSQAG